MRDPNAKTLVNEALVSEMRGLGADTIRQIAEGPYRKAEQMRIVELNKIRALVSLRKAGVPSAALVLAADSCGNLDVFEAVCDHDGRQITPEDAAWLLSLKQSRWPWYLRLALWFYQRRMPGE